MDLNDLALFTRVVESGSFTSAARVTGLPKSSVTRSIARLERELGIRLIQRTTRQRGVTDAGRELYERVRGAVGALEAAADTVREHGSEIRGVVRVTAPADIGMMGLPEAFARLIATHPGLHIEMVLTSRVVDLVAEGIDLGIRAGRLADSSLVARKLGTTDLGLFASPAYLKRKGRPKQLAELVDHDCVLFRGKGGTATWELTGPKGVQTVEVRGPISADDFTFSQGAILAGLGIGALPLHYAHRRECNSLERVLPDHAFAGGPLHVVMPSAAFVPARVSVVRDFLVEYLGKELATCSAKAVAHRASRRARGDGG